MYCSRIVVLLGDWTAGQHYYAIQLDCGAVGIRRMCASTSGIVGGAVAVAGS
jgi:hypothetical protein